MDDYKKKLGSLADKIKNDAPHAPIQQVLPIKHQPVSADEEEARFNNWIPKGLKRRIKAYGAQHDISQKDITIEALKDFLKNKGN
ncbi:hypothetical protein PQ469_02885 [Mucilaginibacter sp. KACC 22773]|uniref:hypothetical protein n=1 Tax=Mucilaginibacter sp. KACC 22773 TaxID=3025671 RepID=UPI0023672B81|nr:hypothetical protein [Mucilaginibacter sp. KACC 22773]WDF78949.1 hypothetical protein PQ469_02885 [Mucilaginibacter sp. KACC 22773]